MTRPGFDRTKIDVNDPNTWAMQPEDCCEAADIHLTQEACARIAAVLDRARGQRARATLADREGKE